MSTPFAGRGHLAPAHIPALHVSALENRRTTVQAARAAQALIATQAHTSATRIAAQQAVGLSEATPSTPAVQVLMAATHLEDVRAASAQEAHVAAVASEAVLVAVAAVEAHADDKNYS